MPTRRDILTGTACLAASGLVAGPSPAFGLGLERLIRRKGIYRTQPSDFLAAQGGALWLMLADLPTNFAVQAQLGQRLERSFIPEMGGA